MQVIRPPALLPTLRSALGLFRHAHRGLADPAQHTPTATVDLDALRASFDGHLARYKHPRRIVLRADLPRTALGKVQRPALQALLQDDPAGP